METRGVITIENRTVVMPDAEVWMTIGELANLFYVRGVSVEAAIRRLGKDGIMGGESCRRIRLGEKCYTEVYGMETVIALSFRFDTGQAALFRKWIAWTAARSGKEPTVMFLHYPHGTYC
ncbi:MULTISPECIES: lipofamily protein [Bacteroidaceae]|uniref:lipofamily protein n=1 Tax=Bacteroidaceae TaxID=815 RepID=UPI003209ABAC